MARKTRKSNARTDLGRPWPVGGWRPGEEPDWTLSTEYRHNGRILTPGTEVSVIGLRGRYRFVKHVSRPNGVEWVDLWGGPGKEESFRSVRPERIRRVHRIARTDKNLLAERREAKRAAA